MRPLPDARVSTPLAWDEVPDCEPADFTVLTMPARFAAIGDPHAGMDDAAGSLEALLELAARDEAAGLGDAPWPPHYRKMEGEAPRVAPSRAKGAAKKPPRVKMPLIVVANSPDKEAALAGLERWKAKHPEAAKHLAVDDVLVDAHARPLVDLDAHPRQPAQRARSDPPAAGDARPRRRSDARVARDVPESDRERGAAERVSAAKRSQRSAQRGGRLQVANRSRELGARRVFAPKPIPLRRSQQLVRRDDLELSEGAVAPALVGPPAAELRGVAEARALHVIVGDLDHELRAERLPRKILALAPAALGARPALPGPPPPSAIGPFLPRMAVERRRRGTAPETRPARAALASVKLAQTPTCCRLPALVVEAEEQRADGVPLAALVPAEAGDDAIAFALVLHLQHDALVGLVGARGGLGHDAVEAGALEALEPVGGDRRGRASTASGAAAASRRASICSERGATLVERRPARSRSPSQSRSKKTIDAGISFDSSFTRDAAG